MDRIFCRKNVCQFWSKMERRQSTVRNGTCKEIFEKISEVKDVVLLKDVVRFLREMNEEIDKTIEVQE